MFRKKAAEWTKKFARNIATDKKVKYLMKAGFAQNQCCDMLVKSNGNLDKALHYLYNSKR